MLRLASYDIVFQEIPGEVTLAVNLSNCPNACKGCHSPHLRDDIGEVLDEEAIAALLKEYGASVSCFCFMGGDADPVAVDRSAALVKRLSGGRLKTAWYSGKDELAPGIHAESFDYIKIGSYQEVLGGLASPTTNQRLYKVENGRLHDITNVFWRDWRTFAPGTVKHDR